MSITDYDPHQPLAWTETVECEIHEIWYRAWTGCPHCADDEADRQYDTQKERNYAQT